MWLRYRFFDTEVDGSNRSIIITLSLGKALNPHCFSRLSCKMSTVREHPREVCLFSAMSFSEEIPLKINAFFYVLIFGVSRWCHKPV